jgi:hypothetical protein
MSSTAKDPHSLSRIVSCDFGSGIRVGRTPGRVVQGRIQAETDDAIVLRGQESFAEAKKILKANIEDRVLSKVSMMPQGTINHLVRDEILDLLAYVLSGKVRAQ